MRRHWQIAVYLSLMAIWSGYVSAADTCHTQQSGISSPDQTADAVVETKVCEGSIFVQTRFDEKIVLKFHDGTSDATVFSGDGFGTSLSWLRSKSLLVSVNRRANIELSLHSVRGITVNYTAPEQLMPENMAAIAEQMDQQLETLYASGKLIRSDYVTEKKINQNQREFGQMFRRWIIDNVGRKS